MPREKKEAKIVLNRLAKRIGLEWDFLDSFEAFDCIRQMFCEVMLISETNIGIGITEDSLLILEKRNGSFSELADVSIEKGRLFFTAIMFSCDHPAFSFLAKIIFLLSCEIESNNLSCPPWEEAGLEA